MEAQLFLGFERDTREKLKRLVQHGFISEDEMKRRLAAAAATEAHISETLSKKEAPPPPPPPTAQEKEDEEPQEVGELLYPRVQAALGSRQDLAGKVTGMLLELSEAELRTLLSDKQFLSAMVFEALEVLGEVKWGDIDVD